MALVVGLWFVAVSAGPELTHACPTHGIHAAKVPVIAGHAGHVAVATTSAVHHSASDTGSAPQQGKQCTCLGQCCSAPPVAVISAAITLADIVTISTRDAGLPDYAYVPVAAQHVLPLAHAPPVSA
jgi:hypothetical protein